MKRFAGLQLGAVLSAAMLGAASLSAYAEGEMTFRLTATQNYVFASALKDQDMVLNGGLYIDNYTGISEVLMYINSDEPLVIENGGFTDPAYFEKSSETTYNQTDEEDGSPLNSVLWCGPVDSDGNPQAGVIANPEGSFLKYDVRVPKGTAPGQYKVYLRDGAVTTAAGLTAYYFLCYNGENSIEVSKTPFVLTVEPDAVRGDVNCDGKIDLFDVNAALDFYSRTSLLGLELGVAEMEEVFTTIYVHAAQVAADVVPDQNVQMNDIINLLEYYTISLLGIEPSWDEIIHS